MEKDPVCGMDVDHKTATLISEYQGKKYYFCGPGCKRDFDKDPGKYVNKVEGGAGQEKPHMHAT